MTMLVSRHTSAMMKTVLFMPAKILRRVLDYWGGFLLLALDSPAESISLIHRHKNKRYHTFTQFLPEAQVIVFLYVVYLQPVAYIMDLRINDPVRPRTNHNIGTSGWALLCSRLQGFNLNFVGTVTIFYFALPWRRRSSPNLTV